MKEVVKSIRKKEKGYVQLKAELISRIMVLAANIAPIDVISHIPVLCEENDIPYIFVSSKVFLLLHLFL